MISGHPWGHSPGLQAGIPDAGAPRGVPRDGAGGRGAGPAGRSCRGRAGPAADGADGGGEQMDGAPDGSGSPGPVQVAPADSGPAAGARGGAGSPDWEGTPFSMTMPRRRVQRRRNQRFIGSS